MADDTAAIEKLTAKLVVMETILRTLVVEGLMETAEPIASMPRLCRPRSKNR